MAPVAAHAANATGGPLSWGWLLAAGVLGVMAWRAFRTRPSAAPWAPGGFVVRGAPAMAGAATAAAMPGPAAPGGYAPGYAPAGPSGGSGLLGTGVALAGGVAAGMLAEKLLEGHHDAGAVNAGASFLPLPRGTGPAVDDDRPVDDAAARELEQRPVDLGSGDGWGGDAGGSASDDGGWGGGDAVSDV